MSARLDAATESLGILLNEEIEVHQNWLQIWSYSKANLLGKGIAMKTRKNGVLLVCAVVVAAAQPALAAPVQWEQNGHWYEVIVLPTPGVSWPDAQAACEAKGGYLATITSAEENQFVFDLTVNTPGAWAYSAEWAIGPCLGGYQDLNAPDYSEPLGGWRWVTGEAWEYTNWLGGQPDNWLNFEHRLIFWSYWSPAPTWNDFNGDEGIINYVIEYDSEPGGNTPPTADAGEDVVIFTCQQATTILQGTASDPDLSDTLQYRWVEGEGETQVILKDWTAVGIGGIAALDLSTVAQWYLPGVLSASHDLALEVMDGKATTADSMVLTLFNTDPEVQPAATSWVVAPGDPISIPADAADFDGDTLSYEWRKGSDVLASGTVLTPSGGEHVNIAPLTGTGGVAPFLIGVNELVVSVNDGVNPAVGVSVTIEVADTEAPTLAPVPSQTMLWPPNHNLCPVTIQANASDNSGGPVALGVTITCNETDDGNQEPDWYIDSVDSNTGTIQLRLRAERPGSGDGRVYSITITATDASDNQSVAVVEIRVPHDQRKK